MNFQAPLTTSTTSVLSTLRTINLLGLPLLSLAAKVDEAVAFNEQHPVLFSFCSAFIAPLSQFLGHLLNYNVGVINPDSTNPEEKPAPQLPIPSLVPTTSDALRKLEPGALLNTLLSKLLTELNYPNVPHLMSRLETDIKIMLEELDTLLLLNS